MWRHTHIGLLSSCVAIAIAGGSANAQGAPDKQAFFGETHLHTAYSLDAYIGGARVTPDLAFRFAKGAPIMIDGRELRISRPLDFAAVTDHAEYLGEMYSTLVEGAPGHNSPELQELRGLRGVAEREAWFVKYVVSSNRSGSPQHPPFFAGPQTTVSAWDVAAQAVEDNYEPGVFTTIHAFEWSAAPNGANLHRNVFFRDDQLPDKPLSYVDAQSEEALWDWLETLENQSMTVFAAPHNSNASKGRMFPGTDSAGQPITAAYAARRARFEPLIEMMQVKGNSEVHRRFWMADEFADFENADSIANYSGREFARLNYVRGGVIEGLRYQQELGANPFAYGFIGGTDNHNGATGNTAEDNWAAGSHGAADGTIERRRQEEVAGWMAARDLNPGALTGVWAPENTRAAIWDAMKAKETFATSGTRASVRLFAGFGLNADLTGLSKIAADGYAKGVPMGGTLAGAADAGALDFVVWAAKDADGANLDRIQIIKGWITPDGTAMEQIHNVAWSARSLDADGTLAPVGSTVDVTTGTYTNSIGAPELFGRWRDENFDPAQNAVYYARVLEIPTPRWSTYDAIRAGLPLLDDVPAVIQERVWASPIWYNAG